MSSLTSPSDNSGWGVGYRGMRATGVSFSLKQPVRVRAHYRSQWGQKNGRRPVARLRTGLKQYLLKYHAMRKGRGRKRGALVGLSHRSAFAARLTAAAVRAALGGKRRRRRR